MAIVSDSDGSSTLNKSSWTTMIQATKVYNDRDYQYLNLFANIGHNKAVNKVKGGYQSSGSWHVLWGTVDGVQRLKDNVKKMYKNQVSIKNGTPVRVRGIIDSSNGKNSGFSTDKVAFAWYWN